jgi:hypothetical protein
LLSLTLSAPPNTAQADDGFHPQFDILHYGAGILTGKGLSVSASPICYSSDEFFALAEEGKLKGKVMDFQLPVSASRQAVVFPLPQLPVINEFLVEMRQWVRAFHLMTGPYVLLCQLL